MAWPEFHHLCESVPRSILSPLFICVNAVWQVSVLALNAPAAALGAHQATGVEGELPIVSPMPARRCIGRIKEDGSVEACCFNGRSVGQPANALTEDGRCVWCSPAEMHRRTWQWQIGEVARVQPC